MGVLTIEQVAALIHGDRAVKSVARMLQRRGVEPVRYGKNRKAFYDAEQIKKVLDEISEDAQEGEDRKP